jgi:hypothetical protein
MGVTAAMADSIWIITPGGDVDFDVAALGIKAKPNRVMAYGLSDIGRYLIHPGPIEVENQLMGCECEWLPGGSRVRRIFQRMFTRRNGSGARRVFISRNAYKIPTLTDCQLADHVENLRGMLESLDPVFQEIASIDLQNIAEIRGICEDQAGHRTVLNLQGDMTTKQQYILDHLLKPVRTTLISAHIADGLYEMRALNWPLCHHHRIHRLLRFDVDGKCFVGLLNSSGRLAFWINDIKHLHRLTLLQQALDASRQLTKAFNHCLTGKADPMRLMFNPKLDIDYTRNRIPQIYQDLFRRLNLDRELRRSVIGALNHHQLGVSLSYVAHGGYGDPHPITNVSVMHDVKALEPLRTGAPQVFAAISRRATTSEAGQYYLLEDIQGCSDASRA